MPLYHILAWGVPILVVFPLLCFKKLAYAPFVSGVWCYMEIYHNMPPFARDDYIAFTFVKMPELVSFVLILVVFIITCWKFHKRYVKCMQLLDISQNTSTTYTTFLNNNQAHARNRQGVATHVNNPISSSWEILARPTL